MRSSHPIVDHRPKEDGGRSAGRGQFPQKFDQRIDVTDEVTDADRKNLDNSRDCSVNSMLTQAAKSLAGCDFSSLLTINEINEPLDYENQRKASWRQRAREFKERNLTIGRSRLGNEDAIAKEWLNENIMGNEFGMTSSPSAPSRSLFCLPTDTRSPSSSPQLIPTHDCTETFLDGGVSGFPTGPDKSSLATSPGPNTCIDSPPTIPFTSAPWGTPLLETLSPESYGCQLQSELSNQDFLF